MVGCSPDGLGSIPACAGEPWLLVALRWRHRVYPRVCGGTRVVIPEDGLYEGLSPRVRGNPRLTFRLCAGIGSIPACAGEPLS